MTLQTDSTSRTAEMWFSAGAEQAGIPWDGRGDDPVWYEAELTFSVAELRAGTESEVELSGDIDGEGFVALAVKEGVSDGQVAWSSANAFGAQGATVALGEQTSFRTHLQISNVRPGKSSLLLQVIAVGEATGVVTVDLDQSWIGCTASPPNNVVLEAEVTREPDGDVVLSYVLRRISEDAVENVTVRLLDESDSFVLPGAPLSLGRLRSVSTEGSLILPVRRTGPYTLLIAVESDNPGDRQFVELTGTFAPVAETGRWGNRGVWAAAAASVFATVLGLRLLFSRP